MEIMIYAILSVMKDTGKLNNLLAGMKGISGTELYVVSRDEVAAVVSNIERSRLVADRAGAIAYAGIIETMAQQFTLLPMRFGSALESTNAIRQMLGRNYPGIHHNLQQVENKFEFGLKVFCDSGKIKEELLAKKESETKTAADPGQEIRNSVYREYVNKKLKEHRLEEMLLSYVDSVIEEITGCLVRLNAIHKFKKMATTSIIVDSVFLLDKGRKDGLIEAVGNLQTYYPGLNFVITGPWPPYNFVETTIT